MTSSNTNWIVQPQKKARCLKFRNLEVEGLYYLCSENKGTDQLCGYQSAPLFSHKFAKIRSSRDPAHLMLHLFSCAFIKPLIIFGTK